MLRRMSLFHKREALPAVSDETLDEVLEALDLLAPLEAGSLTCPTCGRLLTRANIGTLSGSPSRPLVFCDASACITGLRDPVKDVGGSTC